MEGRQTQMPGTDPPDPEPTKEYTPTWTNSLSKLLIELTGLVQDGREYVQKTAEREQEEYEERKQRLAG